MSDEKVLTGDVDASGWFINPMSDLFQMKNKKLWMTVQPDMNNIGICSVVDETVSGIPEDFEELDEEDARLILLSIKNALERALAGEGFELNIEPMPRRKSPLIPEGHIWISTGPEANQGYSQKIEVLTNEIVKQFLAESVETREGWWIERIDFDEFTEIEDAAAESFRKHAELARTKQCEDECWSEMILRLNSLTQLSDAGAESLGKFTGEGLWLNGLSELSDAAVESLNNYEGDLELNLDILPESAAKIFREGNKLTKEIAEQVLADESNVDTNRFWAIEDVAVEILSKNEEILFLGGLTQLSDAAAEGLGKHEGVLALGGLKSLSDTAAKCLSKHKGELSLDGLTSLSDVAVESLSKCKGDVNFNGLKSLSDSAADSLSKHEGSLDLSNVRALSDAAAESLSKHKGSLRLGLTELSDAAAESLGKYEGDLNLYLDELPESAAKILRDAGQG